VDERGDTLLRRRRERHLGASHAERLRRIAGRHPDRPPARQTLRSSPMFDHLVRDFQVLQKADFLIGKIWLNVLVRRAGLFAFAALVGGFGLGRANVAGFYALQTSLGSVWAAAIIAAFDFVIAAIVLLVGGNTRP